MRKLIYILLVCLIAIQVNAQKVKFDTDYRTVVVNYSDSTVKATVLQKNVKVKAKLDVIYYWYNSNKIKKNLGGFSGKLLYGDYRTFDLNKNLITQGEFKKGIKSGLWKKWYSTGGIMNLQNYKRGLKQGKTISYDQDGNLVVVCNYRRGVKNGKCINYYNGKPYEILKYKNNELHGCQIYIKAGDVKEKVTYKKGKKVEAKPEKIKEEKVKEEKPKKSEEEGKKISPFKRREKKEKITKDSDESKESKIKIFIKKIKDNLNKEDKQKDKKEKVKKESNKE